MDDVAGVRAFNRFYTRWVGALDEGFLATRRSLPEARVLFELGKRETTEVAELRATLELDAGYLSRLLQSLEREGLVGRARSVRDARRQVVRLTKSGRSEFRLLDRRSAERIGAELHRLRPGDRDRLVESMTAVAATLGEPGGTVALRPPRPGDHGWIVERHGALYADEYGWDVSFEALVARIVADFAGGHDPDREAAWIAELDGARAGCVLCVRENRATAKLRLLLVEPWARGRGIGTRLVDECVGFARRARYERIALWTNDVLESARRIYEAAGFEVAESEPHHSFGHDLVGQNWARALA